MTWSATKNADGSLHVVNDQTGQHFEAADEAEVNEVIDALRSAENDSAAQEEAAAKAASDDVSMPSDEVTVEETEEAPPTQ